MTRRTRAGAVGMLAAAVVLAGCMRTVTTRTVVVEDNGLNAPLSTATNLPARFAVVREGQTATACPVELADPPGRLLLRRSFGRPVQDSTGVRMEAVGDYAVQPPGRYGTTPGTGLRVDCERLRGLGVVPLN